MCEVCEKFQITFAGMSSNLTILLAYGCYLTDNPLVR